MRAAARLRWKNSWGWEASLDSYSYWGRRHVPVLPLGTTCAWSEGGLGVKAHHPFPPGCYLPALPHSCRHHCHVGQLPFLSLLTKIYCHQREGLKGCLGTLICRSLRNLARFHFKMPPFNLWWKDISFLKIVVIIKWVSTLQITAAECIFTMCC